MLIERYLTTTKNLPAIMAKIVEGTAPSKFNVDHLQGLGFKGSGDRAIVPLLKDLGFLTADGVPTKRYLDYRDPTRSRKILGEALREGYEDLFHISEKLSDTHRKEIIGKYKSTHNSTDKVAELQAMTFLALLRLSDIETAASLLAPPAASDTDGGGVKEPQVAPNVTQIKRDHVLGGLHYTIEIHLPPTKDIDVFNSIFKSLREHLID
jgi:hypothetical protein